MAAEDSLRALLHKLLEADVPGKRQLLFEHSEALLDGKAEAMLREDAKGESDAEVKTFFEAHALLLAVCREEGSIDAGFARAVAAGAADLIGELIGQLMRADFAETRQLIETHRAILLHPAIDDWFAAALAQEQDTETRQSLAWHGSLLRICREEESIDAGFARVASEQRAAQLHRIAQRMIAEPAWRELRVLVEQMPEDLLGEEFDHVLAGMVANLEAYRACLRECKIQGVDVAFRRRGLASRPVVIQRAALPENVADRLDQLNRLDGEAAGDLEREILLLRELLTVLPEGSPRAAIQYNLGNALRKLGERERSTTRLEEAVLACRAALQEYTYERAPVEWAAAQNNLGAALRALGEREGGTAHLEQAVLAHRTSLQEYTRERSPFDWAMTQNNLALALESLGARDGIMARLEEAVVAYRAALQELTREETPVQWAMTQTNLGVALRALGERQGGTAFFQAAAAAYRAALEERTRERAPLEWATTQNNLGVALGALGEREIGTTHLWEAVVAYRAALEERTRERAPLEWAATQNNLGVALETLGARESSTVRLEEAVVAYRAALKERTRERTPLDWAATQNNVGTALARLGEQEGGAARLEDAVVAYRAALQEYTRERVPLQWALTQNNLANALVRLGEQDAGTAWLEEAIAACRTALEERTRERSPFEWAMTQSNLGAALRTLAQRADDRALWREAAEVFEHLVSARMVIALVSARNPDQQYELAGLSELGDEAALAWLAAGDPQRGLRAAHCARAVQTSVVVWADREAADDAAARDLRARRADWQASNDAADAAYRQWESTGRAEDWQRYQMQVAVVTEAFEAFRTLLPEPPTLDLVAVAAALPQGGALVTVVAGETRGAAILLRAASSAASPEIATLPLPLLTRAALRILIAGEETDGENAGWIPEFLRFRQAMQTNDRAWQPWLSWNAAIVRILQRMSELGFGALHRWLHEDRAIAEEAEIVMAPPGWLSVLPFAAAGDPGSDRCLLDDYAVRLIPNAELLLGCAATAAVTERQPPSLLAVTDPGEDLLDPGDRISPATAAFADLPQEALAGAQATRERVLERLPKFSHYVHYGHAGWTGRGNELQLADDPRRPDTGGMVSDSEIRRLHLSRLRLAVLAACETGLIDLRHGDEFVGLIESFLQASCAGVIASLWPVETGATYRVISDTLVQHMHDHSSNRRSPARALRDAQLALRNTGLPIIAGWTQHTGRPRGTTRLQETIPGTGLGSDQPVFWTAFICAGA
jgi:tetratricopeptide (TPR) repeat protein